MRRRPSLLWRILLGVLFLVFAPKVPANIKRVLMGEQIGTYVGFDE